MSRRRRSCAVDLAPVRAEPREDAEQVTQLLRGEPLVVTGERGEWARVETAYGYLGWAPREAVAGPPLEGAWPVPVGSDLLAEARAYLGAPYEWGGMSERGIDCSGLVHMAFRRIGVVVPRDSWQQEEAGEPVAEGDLRPGDVLCYPRHVAFWAAGGRILHASGRKGVEAVVEELEPAALAAKRRTLRRLGPKRGSGSPSK